MLKTKNKQTLLLGVSYPNPSCICSILFLMTVNGIRPSLFHLLLLSIHLPGSKRLRTYTGSTVKQWVSGEREANERSIKLTNDCLHADYKYKIIYLGTYLLPIVKNNKFVIAIPNGMIWYIWY